MTSECTFELLVLALRDSRKVLYSAFLTKNDATNSESLRKPGLYFLMLVTMVVLRFARYRSTT